MQWPGSCPHLLEKDFGNLLSLQIVCMENLTCFPKSLGQNEFVQLLWKCSNQLCLPYCYLSQEPQQTASVQISTPKPDYGGHNRLSIDRLSIIPKFERSFAVEDSGEDCDFEVGRFCFCC